MAGLVWERLREAQANQEDFDVKNTDKPVPLLHLMLAQLNLRVSDGFSPQDIVSECMAHLIAGIDTSTTTFGFMVWELSRRPDVIRRLREELDEIIPDRRTLPDYRVLMKQSYLTAFLNEGFRMYAAVSSILERVVPSTAERQRQGILGVESFDIMGHEIPPGTVVGTQAFSVHRDPDVFPSPERFDSGRWLSPSGDGPDDEALQR
ncbi:hypothetical protein NUW54_g7342 [Trametes sanguinea]|uniref:Uncharacterized protein n=1 Tax=Trametes sanguinea TaxID=158606 RepID=A0ACC1PM92_9APHY|nr:hypothetical protein NUW54_g7342 [Trametes sanguinea]